MNSVIPAAVWRDARGVTSPFTLLPLTSGEAGLAPFTAGEERKKSGEDVGPFLFSFCECCDASERSCWPGLGANGEL
jgi:hypothetical protein